MSRASSSELGLVTGRVALGVFFFFEGLDKFPWLAQPEQLTEILERWAESARPLSKWYVQTVALPGASLFARLVFFGEVLAGLALVVGFWTRPTAILTFLLVVNIHLAHSALLAYSFLSKGDGLPVLGGLLALAIGGGRLPFSLIKRK